MPYVDYVEVLNVNGVEHGVGASRHTIVNRDEHKMLVDYDAVVVRTVERVDALIFVAVRLFEDRGQLLGCGHLGPHLA